MARSAPHRLILDPTATTTIVIGPEQRIFSIHKSLLCSHTQYFESAYRSQLREALENRFVIDDVNPSIFAVVFAWLYSGQVYLNASNGQAQEPLKANLITSNQHMDFGERDFEPACVTAAHTFETESTGSAEYYEYLDPIIDRDADVEDQHEDYVDWGVADEDWPDEATEQYYFCNFFSSASKSTQAEDLEIYELEVLLLLLKKFGDPSEFVLHWKAVLEEKRAKRAEEAEEGVASSKMTLDDVFETLIEVYILADRFGIPFLRRDLMDHLETQRQGNADDLGPHLPPFRLINRAFASLPSNSPLLLWLVHIFAYDWDPSADSDEDVVARQDWPAEFLMEVLLINTKRLPRRLEVERAPFDVTMCFYHEHADKKEMRECMQERREDEEEDCEWDDSDSSQDEEEVEPRDEEGLDTGDEEVLDTGDGEELEVGGS